MKTISQKWRPSTFAEIAGQHHITRTLSEAIRRNRVSHAYLFQGSHGTGKTTMARLLGKGVNCVGGGEKPCNVCKNCSSFSEGSFVDFIEIDGASNTGVDNIRDLRDKARLSPSQGFKKIYVIDEAHMLSNAAFNALLKIIEEPPEHIIFILATTEGERILETVRSRCQIFVFGLLSSDEIIKRLGLIAHAEQIVCTDDALRVIARESSGSMRDSEVMLDQLLALNEKVITAQLVRNVFGIGSESAVKDILQAWLNKDASAGLMHIENQINNGVDPNNLIQQLIRCIRDLLVFEITEGEIGADNDFPDSLVGSSSVQSLSQAIKEFSSFSDGVFNSRARLEMPFFGISSSLTTNKIRDIWGIAEKEFSAGLPLLKNVGSISHMENSTVVLKFNNHAFMNIFQKKANKINSVLSKIAGENVEVRCIC